MVDPTIFLAKLAKNIYTLHGKRLEKVALIFPSSGASYQFRNCLGQHLNGPAWAPAQYSLSDFMQMLWPVKKAPKLTLLSYLYRSAKEVGGEKISFTAFCNGKGSQLYDLFEELVQYDIDGKMLFTPHPTLAQLKALPIAQQKKVMAFWDKAHDGGQWPMLREFIHVWQRWRAIYNDFHQRLEADGLVFTGTHYQLVYNKLLAGKIKVGYDHVIPIGLQPLTPLVRKIFHLLAQQCDLSLYYDTDDYYMTSSLQEAGHFLRAYAKDKVLGKELQGPYSQALAAQKATIQLFPSATEVGQAERLGEVLHRLMKEDNAFQPAKGVVILADTALLLPVLHSVPKGCPLLIDMSYPMNKTPLYALLLHLLKFHYYQQQYHIEKKSGSVRRPSPVLKQQLTALLSHPYIAPKKSMATLLANRYAIAPTAARQTANIPPLWRFLLTPPTQKKGIWNYFVSFLALLVDSADTPWAPWEEVTIKKVSVLCAQLAKGADTSSPQIDWALIDFFAAQMTSIPLPFDSETQEGLRITSIGQVDLLDFDYIFILSMNEGKFPPTGSSSSIVPPTLREAYGLPTAQTAASLYAYYFYRLLQRAKKAFFFYHEGKRGGQTSAVSRYLLQLEYEAKWPFTIEKATHHIVLPPTKSITIAKEKSILAELATFTTQCAEPRPLTPSAVNTYLNCPLRFYFTYIAKLKTPLPPAPLMHPAHFGQLLHQIMEQIYTPYIGKSVSKASLHILKKDVPKIITACFTQLAQQPENSDSLGAQPMMERILDTLVQQILRVDEKYAPFIVKGLELGREKRLTSSLPLADGRQVAIGGMIDRIDLKQHILRVIDYKSGAFNPKIGKLPALFDHQLTNRNTIALQILWYSWLYHKTQKDNSHQIKPTIISTRNLFEPTPTLGLYILNEEGKHVPLTDIAPYADLFAQELTKILEEIFDPQVPFSQTTDPARCTLCPYKTICQR